MVSCLNPLRKMLIDLKLTVTQRRPRIRTFLEILRSSPLNIPCGSRSSCSQTNHFLQPRMGQGCLFLWVPENGDRTDCPLGFFSALKVYRWGIYFSGNLGGNRLPLGPQGRQCWLSSLREPEHLNEPGLAPSHSSEAACLLAPEFRDLALKYLLLQEV